MGDLTAPAHLWIPERDGSAGAEAVELAATVGWHADPEQELMLDAMLSERGGKWAAFETAIIESRQNGKTDSGQVAGLHDLFVRRVGRVVWTAHKYKTTADSFEWFAGVCENYDHLRKRVYKIQYASGEQSIRLLPRHTGPRMDFLARATGGGRGLDGDVVNLDEALYLQPTTMGALLPVLSAKPDPQVRYFSSPGVLTSQVLRGLRDRGRAGGDPTLVYLEWAAIWRPCEDPECQHRLDSVGCFLDDEVGWKQANPALGRRITYDYVRSERRALAVSPVEFMRERLGHWEDPPTADGTVDNGLPGYDLATTDRAPVAPLTLGLEVSTDSRTAAIAVHGADVVEVIEYRKGAGLGWVPSRVTELRERYSAAVAVRAGSPALQLLPELPDAVVVKSTEQAAACMSFATAMNAGDLLHRAQPVLDIAAANAVRARVGDVWRWSLSKSAEDRGTDISPLWAAVLARHIGAAAEPEYDVMDSIY